MSAAHSDNRRAKAARLAKILFGHDIHSDHALTMTDEEWAMLNEVDARRQRRRGRDLPKDPTREQTIEALRELEWDAFRARLKELQRFCRNEQRRLRRAK